MKPKHKTIHTKYVDKLVRIGEELEFEVMRTIKGKMYELATPDCIWYYSGKGEKVLRKIAKGDKGTHLPIVAFEVASSEQPKNLRGTLVSLQLANAAASVIVLIGKTAKNYTSYINKLVGRYSSTRFRIWTEKDVNKLYGVVFKQGKHNGKTRNMVSLKRIEAILKNKYDIAVGANMLEGIKDKVAAYSRKTIAVRGRSLISGNIKTARILLKSLQT